jgi:2'-5' RNA ligase
MAAIRTFIAIKLDEALHRRLARLQDELKPAVPHGSVRWVAPENIHLTLKFLGDVEPARIEAIAAAMRAAAAGAQPCSFEVAGLGCFPNTRRPNVIWVGLSETSGALAALQAAIETELSRLGFPPEARGFSPHLTLGRVRRESRPADIQEIGRLVEAKKIGSLGRQTVSSVTLFESDLRPEGAVYTALAEAPIGRTAG